jgi:hypothetical protein
VESDPTIRGQHVVVRLSEHVIVVVYTHTHKDTSHNYV